MEAFFKERNEKRQESGGHWKGRHWRYQP